MSDELKSAFQIALEKLEGSGQVRELSDSQRESIAAVRRKYRARIAEQEIEMQGQVRAARQSGKFHEIEKLQGRLAAERRRLEDRMESEIEEIRKGSGD